LERGWEQYNVEGKKRNNTYEAVTGVMVIVIDSMGSICSSSNNNNNNAALPPKDLGELVQQAEKGGGSSPWLSEFETYLSKLDRENLARATMPKPQPQPQPPQHQPPQPQLPGNQDCQQLKPLLLAEPQTQTQGPAKELGAGGGEAERSLAWRIPLLRFIIEARTVLNVATSDDQVEEGLVRLSKEHLCPEGGLPLSDAALRERLVDSLSHWTNPNGRRGLMSSSALVLGKTPASKEALLKDLQAAYLDNLVWDRAEKLYRKFCEKRAAGGLPPLAVLLSIL